MSEDDLLAFNGVNGSTGNYGLRLTNAQLADKITGLDDEYKDDPALQRRKQRDDSDSSKVIELRAQRDQLMEQLVNAQSEDERKQLKVEINRLQGQIDEGHKGVKEGIDGTDIKQAGWGIVFAAKHDQTSDLKVAAIKEALKPLLDLRQSQAGKYFKIYEGPNGYRPNEKKSDFLRRIGADTSGPADPDKAPYYLLLVGSPEALPYSFQYQLDVQYGVGRLFFDTLQEYANYASSVAAAAAGQITLPRRFALFGVSNADDQSTALSSQYLVQPLLETFRKKEDWEVQPFLNEAATRSQLERLLGGDQTPALLFTASHGMEFDPTDKRQISHQGALLCQDWPGPTAWRGEIPENLYFAGDHIARDANPLGLITFHFACYGAGTPLYDEFSQRSQNAVCKAIAPRPFIAGLPTKLLGHPKGGALAVLGHVERAWGYSFVSAGNQTKKQTVVFESTLERILKGNPVGWATEYFNGRYAELSSDLSTVLDNIGFGEKSDPADLTALWTANNDARGYVIIGDPAVSLPVAANDQAATGRVEIRVQAISVSSTVAGSTATLSKPAAISDEDWQRTPATVQQYVLDLEAKLSKPKAAKTNDDDGW